MNNNKITYTRTEAIDYLVQRDESDIQQMINQDDWDYLEGILRNGFVGYATLSNDDLKTEIENSTADDQEIEVVNDLNYNYE